MEVMPFDEDHSNFTKFGTDLSLNLKWERPLIYVVSRFKQSYIQPIQPHKKSRGGGGNGDGDVNIDPASGGIGIGGVNV